MAQGAFTKLSINTKKICFESIRDLTRASIYDHSKDLMCGTLEHASTDQSRGPISVGLQVRLQPTPEELVVLLPLIGFSAVDGTTYSLQDAALTTFAVEVDRVEKVHNYANCVVAKATFRGTRQGPLSLELLILGKTVSEANSGTFAGTAVSPNSDPYMLSDGVLTLNGNTYPTNQFVYVLDNKVVPQWNNSETVTSLDQTDREQHVAVGIPYSSDVALVTAAIGSSRTDGYSGSFVLTSGAKATSFLFDVLKRDGTLPDIPDKTELKDMAVYRVFNNTGNSNSSTRVTNVLS